MSAVRDGVDIAPARNRGPQARRASPGRPHGTAIRLVLAYRSNVTRQLCDKVQKLLG